MQDILVDLGHIIERVKNFVWKLSLQISDANWRHFSQLRLKLATLTLWSSDHDIMKQDLAFLSFILELNLDELLALVLTNDKDSERNSL